MIAKPEVGTVGASAQGRVECGQDGPAEKKVRRLLPGMLKLSPHWPEVLATALLAPAPRPQPRGSVSGP